MSFEYLFYPALTCMLINFFLPVAMKPLLYQIAALRTTRDHDKSINKRKWKERSERYQNRFRSSRLIGLLVNVTFYLGVLPFIVTFDTPSGWRVLVEVVVILMVYDLLYYLTHRFLFHGKGYFRRVHAVHHQARSRVSSIDSFLLHPAEIFIGILLFHVTTFGLALTTQQPFSVVTIAITGVIYTQLNIINHTHITIGSGPFKLFDWIAMKHDAHHIDMHHGNYSTITLFYDWLFRTLEVHPREHSADLSAEG